MKKGVWLYVLMLMLVLEMVIISFAKRGKNKEQDVKKTFPCFNDFNNFFYCLHLKTLYTLCMLLNYVRIVLLFF